MVESALQDHLDVHERILERRLIDRKWRREPNDLVVRLLGENPLGLKGLAEGASRCRTTP